MLKWLGSLIDSNDKQIKKIHPIVDKINKLEDDMADLSDEELKHKTTEFKERITTATAATRKEYDDKRAEADSLKNDLANNVEGYCPRINGRTIKTN